MRRRRRRSSVDEEERRFSLSKGGDRIERATGDDRRLSARSQAKVDKGSPSRTVRLQRVGRGKESRVGREEEEERSRRRYYRHLSEIDVPRHGTKTQRG